MQGIIVVDEIPKSCETCKWCINQCELGTIKWCGITGLRRPNDLHDTRPNWCPIKELPKKKNWTNLSDTNALKAWGEGWNDCLEVILELGCSNEEEPEGNSKEIESKNSEETKSDTNTLDLSDEESKKYLGKEINLILKDLGVPAHIVGYSYLKESLLISLTDIEAPTRPTKLLYPDLAKMFKTTSTKIERGLRGAIETSWNRGNVDLFERIFGYSREGGFSRPTNSEYIATVADYIRLTYNVKIN